MPGVLSNGWSRNVLNIHIERRLLEREGKAVTNFDLRLPKPHSDLAHESLNDPYLFDFLGVGDEAGERAIEDAIVQHITRFLLELPHFKQNDIGCIVISQLVASE